ncbi:NAD(P)/FAD-dependent oxidoreductase [archaeon]|nr:MAG: NAD(P)/FAD-dependent oxidoreductase [archaeon]
MNSYDVAVIGGGPIGAVAARYAAATGARTLLVDQGDGSCEPARCAGLVSPRTPSLLGTSSTGLLREIHGAIIHSPTGKQTEILSKKVKAIVLDRSALNRELVKLAAQAGVEVRHHTRAAITDQAKLQLSEQNRQYEAKARVVIGADGPRSMVASRFSLPSPPRFLAAVQATIVREARASEMVEIFFGTKIAPGFFAWAVPAKQEQLRVGLAATQGTDVNTLLNNLLSQHFPGQVISYVGGIIPVGTAAKTTTDGALIVGDAAGQVKPTSGGGIYTGGLCAKIAGEIAGYASLAEKTTNETLKEYEHRWQDKIGKELRFGLLAHRAFCGLSDAEIEAALAIINQPSILQAITEYGDIDYPSMLVSSLLSRQDLWPRLLSLIPALGGWEKFGNLAQLVISLEQPGRGREPKNSDE